MEVTTPLIPGLLGMAVVSLSLGSMQSAAVALEEVIVTAQKRAQNVQDVPIAISSINEEYLVDTGIDKITQALPLLPGVSGATYGIGTNAWAIRGITSNDWSIGSEPSVAIYIDEAYVGRNMLATSSFFDVARLEALKGPQGTLFGRNAAAGAITLRTNQPAFENTLQLGVGVGNEGQYNYDAIANYALGDNFALRFAYRGSRIEGVWEDVINNTDMYRDEDAFRLSALWDINDQLQAVLAINYGDQETNSNGFNNPQLSSLAPGDEYPRRVAWDAASAETNETQGANLRLEWDLSESLTFTSITDFRDAENNFLNDVDGSNNGAAIARALGIATGSASLAFEQEGTSAQTFAQEFRLAGSRDTLDWFVGVNYYREKLAENQNTILSNTNTLIPLGELARDKNIIRGDNDSYGIYADISWSLSTALRITAGLRYTVDEKAYCTQGRADLGFISTNTLAAVCDTERWEEVTPRLVVDYQLADTAMAYASISRGYKAGGYNPAAVDTDGDGYGDRMAAFAPEENISYELGIKSELLDNRLRLNAAVFYADYDELQVQQATVGGIIIDNAAAADIAGGEIELSYAASEYLTLSANYARVDGEYEDNGVYDGSQLIYSPENSYALNAKYRYPTATGEWSAFAFYSWQSETFYTPINNEALKEPSYGLLGARLAYSPSSGRWDIALAGDNLLDQEYAAFRQDIGIGLGPHLVRGLPRLYTLSFNLYL